MSKILFIGENISLLQKCAEKLRWRGYEAIVHEDVYEGLREAMMFNIGCIVWDVEAKDPARARKYKAIQRYHRNTPVIIIDDQQEIYEPDLDADTHFLSNSPSSDQVFNKVLELVPRPTIFSDTDDMDTVETDYIA